MKMSYKDDGDGDDDNNKNNKKNNKLIYKVPFSEIIQRSWLTEAKTL